MKINTFLKRFIGVTSALSLLGTAAYAEEIFILSDGAVSVDDSSVYLNEGDVLNVTAVQSGFDFLNSESINVSNKEKIVYMGTITAERDGAYTVEFMPNKNGKIKLYVGSDVFDEPKEYDIRYINETKFVSAAETLLGCADDTSFAQVLTDKKDDLGLTDEIFDGIDFGALAKIMRKSAVGLNSSQCKEIITAAEKSAVAVKLNAGEIDDLYDYIDILGLEDTTYFTSDLSESVGDYASNKSIETCAELDEYVRDGIVFANIKNKRAAAIGKMLKHYAKDLGIETSKITDSLCGAIEGKTYTDMTTLVSYINNYKAPTTKPAQTGGTGGGGGGGIKNPLADTTATTPTEDQKPFELEDPFTDLNGFEWAEESIKNLYYKSVLNGKEEGKFYPNDSVTREEFAKLITVAMKMNLVDAEIPFTDVEQGSWYEPYVRTAYLAQIAKGVTDTEFGTGRNITREDLCVMVCRAADAGDYELTKAADGEMNFDDNADISDYAKDSVEKLYRAGIVNGSDGCFNPRATATRAEAAKIIYMVITNIGI